MATVPQPYHRVHFSVHAGGKPVPMKLALKPDSTIGDALVQLRKVWSADNSKQSILLPNELAVMDSEGFWLPSYSPVNCVLKVNDKVSVYKSNKGKKDMVQEKTSKKRKAQSDDDVAASSPAVQASVASPKKKSKHDKSKHDKTETKVEPMNIDTKDDANDVKPPKEDNKRKRKKEKKKEMLEEKKAEDKKSLEKKSAEKKPTEKKSAEKKGEDKKSAEKKIEIKKSTEKKDEQKQQSVPVVVTEPASDNTDLSDAPLQKQKRTRKARQDRRADKKVNFEASSPEADVKSTAVDSSKEVQVTETVDQPAGILGADAPSAGSIGDEESNGQTSSDEVETKKISQAANFLQTHADLLDSIAGSTTDGTSALESLESTPAPEAKKLTKKEQQAIERKEKAAAKQEEAKRKKEEREREQARKKAEKEAAQAKRKEEAQKKKEAGKQKKTKTPVEESADSSSASTQEDNCKNEVSNKLVPSFMPSNRGPSLADIMKNSKDIIQKSIYGDANKKPTTSTSTQSNPIVEKQPPTQASKDSDSDSSSDDEDSNGSGLNHLTSWMNELQQPREKV